MTQFDLFSPLPPPPKRAMAVPPQPARPPVKAELAPPPPSAAPLSLPAEPPTPAEALFPPPPSAAWERRLLAADPVDREPEILVSLLWTKVVAEQLAEGPRGRTLLHASGKIEDIAPDPGGHGRTIFMDSDGVLQLHAQHPMVRIGGGTHSCRYRFARPGEMPPAELELPPGDGKDA